MEFKSILVFSAAIVAMSSPSIASPTNYMTVGEHVKGDRLIGDETIRVFPVRGKPIEWRKVWPLNGSTVTRYEILDRTPKDETAARMTVKRIADTFELVFQSQPGHGIYYDVKVYAK